VFRFDVTMHDAGPVGRLQGTGNLNGCLNRLHNAHPAAGKSPPQSYAVDKLGGDVRRRAILLDFEDRQNVRVVQRRGGASFLNKASHAGGIRGEFLWENLKRDGALQLSVGGLINLTHAAGTDKRADFVSTKSSSRSEVHTNQTERTGSELQSSRGPRKV